MIPKCGSAPTTRPARAPGRSRVPPADARRADESCHEALALSRFFDEAPIGLTWVDKQGRVSRSNHAQAKMLGRTLEELHQQELRAWFADPRQADALLAILASRGTLHDTRVQLRRADGTLVHALADANAAWRDHRRCCSHWFIRNITGRVELERKLLQVVETEHQRFGQDLHDDLCQQLSAVEYTCAGIACRCRNAACRGADQLRGIVSQLRDCNDHARSLARGLMPVNTERLGLMAALRELARRNSSVYRLACRFHCPRSISVDDITVAANLYRIAQESISNAVRHGRAKHIRVDLTRTKDSLTLLVRDDGRGFPAKKKKRGGLGLRIMQYRATAIHGTLALRPIVPHGVEVICTVPIDAERAD